MEEGSGRMREPLLLPLSLFRHSSGEALNLELDRSSTQLCYLAVTLTLNMGMSVLSLIKNRNLLVGWYVMVVSGLL